MTYQKRLLSGCPGADASLSDCPKASSYRCHHTHISGCPKADVSLSGCRKAFSYRCRQTYISGCPKADASLSDCRKATSYRCRQTYISGCPKAGAGLSDCRKASEIRPGCQTVLSYGFHSIQIFRFRPMIPTSLYGFPQFHLCHLDAAYNLTPHTCLQTV